MNLAQLVAPEWAQQNCPPRHDVKRAPGALPPMGTVTRQHEDLDAEGEHHAAPGERGNPRELLLKALSAYAEGVFVSSSDLMRDVGEESIDIGTTCAVLYAALKHKLLERKGKNRRWKYAITARGLAWLKANG